VSVGSSGQKNIGGLDVAVDDAVPVGVIQCLAAFEDDFNHIADGQQSGRLSMRFEGAALDVLHDQVAALLVGHGVQNGDDVRMGKLAGERCLGEKQLVIALAEFLVSECVGAHQFDRNLPIGKRILSQIDLTGRPFPDLLDDFVFADLFHDRGA
jgi:hypothetical protein